MTASTETRDIMDCKLPFNILTDLASPAEWHKTCRQACSVIPALDEILSMIEQRVMPEEKGGMFPIPEQDITLKQAELLFYLIVRTQPILTLETGWGTGLTAAIITAAHMANGLAGGHVPIQDNAKDVLGGIGFHTFERLGLTGYQVMEHESAVVLPQMYLQNINHGLAFAYLNAATEFDEQMMEYYYVNRLLGEGGIIAINTAVPARQMLVDTIRKTRHDYAVRDMGNHITLVQLPELSAILRHNPGLRH